MIMVVAVNNDCQSLDEACNAAIVRMEDLSVKDRHYNARGPA